MNSFTLKIRIDSSTSNYTPDGRICLEGRCAFAFNDRKERVVRPLQWKAYGNTAITLSEAGLDAVVVAIGHINFQSMENPQGSSYNAPTFTIESALVVQPGKSVVSAQPQHQPVATTVPQYQPIATQPTANGIAF